jgi:hypothetical protein
MKEIKRLRSEIGALASALEEMNANTTPETALTVKVANEVFGGMLADLQADLVQAHLEHAKQTLIVI